MVNVTRYNDDNAEHIYIQKITQKKGFKTPYSILVLVFEIVRRRKT